MSEQGLITPGHGGGFREVFRNKYLLKLLVSKEVKVRYRGSVLGILWSYFKPAVQFLVFWVAIGHFLNMNSQVPNFPIYLFSGIILINFFTEALSNASRSIVGNGGLINKIYLPRELFPVASVWVSAIHFVPQLVIMVAASLFFGWRPGLMELGAAVAAFVIVALLATGLGLFFGAVNVYFRDSENFVDMLLMIATWASPVLYIWTMVRNALGDVGMMIYQINPLTPAVELFHYAFWLPTTDRSPDQLVNAMPPHLFTLWTPVALGVALLILILGQFTFSRLEGRFAQEL